jgi:prepilin-type N-terminal cleavage/methylation domain-containing protein
MLHKVKNRKQEGFTIIEVLIVLAIAGLILLIVFLAVPALQRSSRNTQRKNDSAALAGAIANFISNNNGSIPVGLGNNADTSQLDVCAGGGDANKPATTACTATKGIESAKFGYFTADVNTVRMTAVNTTTGFALPVVKPKGTAISDTTVTSDQILIVPKATCSQTTAGKYDYSSRSAIVVYVTESGSGDGTLQCVEQ